MRLVSAVPIIPSQGLSASVDGYRDMLGFTVHRVEAPHLTPWGSTEFGLTDINNLVTLAGVKPTP